MTAGDPIRVLELRSVRGTGGGPEKTILLGAAQADPRRFAVTVCYVRDARDDVFAIGARAARLGIDYVEIRERHSLDPSIWPALRALVRARRIDIVHAHEYKTDLLALLLARVEGVTPLATVHGWSGSSLRERFYYFFDRRLLARYPAVVAVSGEIRQTLIGHGADPSRVHRIPNGVDAVHFRRDPALRDRVRARLGVPEGALVIGSVGRLEGEKRFDLLIEAGERLRIDRPLRIAVIGEGSCRRPLEEQARSLGAAGLLLLPGHSHDPREAHHALDVYVQTSDTEGIPNAVLEAMALETPIVATRVGGTAELVEDGVHGLLVPPRDSAALAAAIERTLADPEGTARRVRAARERVEGELSFQSRQRALEAIYEDLASARRRGRRPSTAAEARP